MARAGLLMASPVNGQCVRWMPVLNVEHSSLTESMEAFLSEKSQKAFTITLQVG